MGINKGKLKLNHPGSKRICRARTVGMNCSRWAFKYNKIKPFAKLSVMGSYQSPIFTLERQKVRVVN